MSFKNSYTKAQLEELIYAQLDNLNAMNDLISIMRHQNDLLTNANKRLKDEIIDFKESYAQYTVERKRKAS